MHSNMDVYKTQQGAFMSEVQMLNMDDIPLPGDEPVTDSPAEEVKTEEPEKKEEVKDAKESESIPEEQEEENEPKSIDDLPLPGDDEQAETKKKDIPKWVEKKLSKKEQIIEQKEREAAELRARLAEVEQVKNIQQIASMMPPPPKEDDFGTREEFLNAFYQYKRAEEEIGNRIKQQTEESFKSRKELESKVESAADRGMQKYDDYDSVTKPLLSPGFPTNVGMGKAVLNSDFAEDIMYFLGRNIDEAKKIAEKSPEEAIKAIARIEMRFREREKVRAAKKITNAPEPPKVNTKGSAGASSASAPSSASIEKMSPDEYKQWYSETYGNNRYNYG